MNRTLEIPHRVYRGIGRCIFCLDDKKKMTVEHIIPLALSGVGEMFIRDGSCSSCNGELNRRFENPALQNDFKQIRAMLELKRRKKRPLELRPFQVRNIFGEMEVVNLTPHMHPAGVAFLMLDRPGMLVGENRGGDITRAKFGFLNIGRGLPWSESIVDTPMVSGAVPLMMAKIAYSYAVAEGYLESFDGQGIRDLLLGTRRDIYNFVGSLPSEAKLPRRHFHQIFIRREGNWLVGIVHLFASFGGPAWEVVLGEARNGRAKSRRSRP